MPSVTKGPHTYYLPVGHSDMAGLISRTNHFAKKLHVSSLPSSAKQGLENEHLAVTHFVNLYRKTEDGLEKQDLERQ